MSYVDVLIVDDKGDVRSYGTARNNHGFAPLVWDYLGKKYGFVKPSHHLSIMDPGIVNLIEEAIRPTEKLNPLSPTERLLLAATVEGVWIPKASMPELVKALLEFVEVYIRPKGYVETARSMAALIQQVLESDRPILGVALDCCSAVESFWSVRGDPEKDESRPFNILTDKRHPQGVYAGYPALDISTLIKPKEEHP